MMLIPVQILPSRIEGLGIFAVAPIAAGTVLWRYTEPIDRKITGGMCRSGVSWERHLERYTYKPHGADYLVLCGDAGMFWNHSNEPNCSEPDELTTVAARDIAAGEELTLDYRLIESRPMLFLDDTPRCERCQWPLAARMEDGCVPGNCSYRPAAR